MTCTEALEQMAGRYRERLAAAQESRGEFYALIREAHSEAGMTVREIGVATGLTFGRIGQIIRLR